MNQLSFKLSKVGVYIQQKYGRRQSRGFAKQGWAGLSMILDTLQREGFYIDFCYAGNVHKYSVVLVSLTSATDWYSFIAERIKWENGNYTVIIGGAGVDNIRPFLEYGDIFVWGRAESIVGQLIKLTLGNSKMNHPSICYSKDFSVDSNYEFCQSDICYPHEITMTNQKRWTEQAIGCQRKCLFCLYTWSRKHVGLLQSQSGSGSSLWGSTVESTIFQLDLDDPRSWDDAAWMTVGIDGLSERLRKMVNKPITNEMLTKFLKGVPKRTGGNFRVKLYQVVGYPTETPEDWSEFREIVHSSTGVRKTHNTSIPKVVIHINPFKSPPCTPAAGWPVEYTNFRDIIKPRLQHENCQDYKYGLYAGEKLDFNFTWGTESLPTTALWMLVFRGVESDAALIRNLATGKFPRYNTAEKLKYLEEKADIDRIFGSYAWNELPTRYLNGPISYDKMANLSDRFLRKYGSENLADKLSKNDIG